MKINKLPHYDDSVNLTGCCPKFNPEGWDRQHLKFKGKKFVHATTRSLMHIPLNMVAVFARILGKIEAADACDPDNYVVMSRDQSPWKSDHYFATDKNIDDEEMTSLSGDYITRVFEGPYKNAAKWHGEMQAAARAEGGKDGPIYFFYTTCPKCAKTYGKNHVVGIAEV